MDRSSNFLITTADERSWRSDRQVLCLGQWCRLFGRKEAWSRLNAVVAPYHWDDRKKLYRDYLYLRKLHEVLLTELSAALNAVHGTVHSHRYWRILIGPWLLYFTEMLFDRWEMIQRTVENYRVDGTVVLEFPLAQVIPKHINDFREMYPTDAWNHSIYARIISGWTSIDCERIPARGDQTPSPRSIAPHGFKNLAWRARNITKRGVSRASQALARDCDAFFLATFLPQRQDFLLQLALGQVPTLNVQVPPPEVDLDLNTRRQLDLNGVGHKGFEQCVRALIPEQIPTVYLEGYGALQDTVTTLPWPRKPKVIFTCASYNPDDVFKGWAALKVESGAPLVIGQHGGNLGSALWTSSEDHEIAIADRYLTWGWSDGNPKQYPVSILKHIGRPRGIWDPTGHLLLMTSVMPRYSYVMGSYTVAAAQVESNLDDQYRFVRALRKDIFAKLVIRLFMPDWGWAQADRWRNEIPSAHIDPGSAPVEPLVRKSRLYIATYNATTFLDSLSRNIPTIMFWDPKHWELRPGAIPYFDKLRQAGVFFSSPEGAAEKVAEVWDDVEGWWDRSEVQDARKHFCNRFARIQDKPIEALRVALSTVK